MTQEACVQKNEAKTPLILRDSKESEIHEEDHKNVGGKKS